MDSNHDRFQWLYVNEVLRSCLKLTALRPKLKGLPKTLDQTYSRILLSIPESRHHEAHAVLQWLAYSTRPTNVAEVAEAIAVDRNNQISYPENRMLNASSVVDIGSSLVTLSERKTALNHDQAEETATLRSWRGCSSPAPTSIRLVAVTTIVGGRWKQPQIAATSRSWRDFLAAGADVNLATYDYGGRTALPAASVGGHLDIVERLLVAGTDVNVAAD
jgi:hypothetical protein